MILFLLDFLSSSWGVKVPAVFAYFSTRMILAAMTTLFLNLLLGPYVIRKLYEMKTGQSIRVEDCPMLVALHEKKKNTPTMGGVLLLFSVLVALVLWMDLKNSFTLLLFVTTVWLGLIGGYDDYLKLKYKNSKGLSGRKKLLLQLLLGFFVGLYTLWPPATEAIHKGEWFSPPVAKEFVHKEEHPLTTQGYMSRYYVPFYKDPALLLKGALMSLGVFLTMVILAGSSNAVNLTDGLDGLAAGCVMLVSFVLALFAFFSNHMEFARYLNILYIEGSGEIAIYLSALSGACLGFLWFNGHPAQVFMGDTGSLALGGILGVSAILLRREVLLALAGGIFVAETCSVMLQVGSYKLRGGKRIFLCTPLHHHFEYKGWSETKVVLRFWIVSLILAMIAIASLKFQ